jgi:hypothetical protein
MSNYPMGVTDDNPAFNLPSGGNDDHECGEDCEGCRELWLRTVMDETAHLSGLRRREREGDSNEQ